MFHFILMSLLATVKNETIYNNNLSGVRGVCVCCVLCVCACACACVWFLIVFKREVIF